MIKKIFFYSLCFVLLIVVLVTGYVGYEYLKAKKEILKLAAYKPAITTQIFDRRGRLIANVFDRHMRFYANFDEIPPRMIEALLAVEDTLFFEHSGINFDAISRAMIKNIYHGRYAEGGSTLTQQLVKNALLTREKSLSRKVKEAIYSIEVEKLLSKEEILEIYLNEIFLGHGYYGVKTAAMGYFHKDLKDLDLKEIAMIVGLPRSPVYYDPTRNLNFSLARANAILKRMYELGWITNTEYETSVKEVPIVYDGTLSQNVAPYVTSEVLRQLKDIKDIKTGGYQIFTNIDLDYQAIASGALNHGYNLAKDRILKDEERKRAYAKRRNKEYTEKSEEDLLDTLNGAMVITENSSGKILALVGGTNFDKSSFNRATQATRQFGSAIKPFIYQIGFDFGFSPATMVPDIARSYEVEFATSNNEDRKEFWRPKNYKKEFSGLVTLQDALTKSLNLATLNMTDLIGFSRIYEKLKSYGFANLPNNMSILLGSIAISPINAAKHYSIFSNYGVMVEPRLIDYIIDDNGNKHYYQKEETPITSPSQSYLITSVLQNAIKNGTGKRANVKGIELAGKTGTSNANVDSWFCGYSPSVQAIVWYGRDNNVAIGKYETGGVIAAPAFSYFFRELLKIEPGIKRRFDVPNGDKKSVINGKTYYYTETSPLPSKNKNDNLNSKLIF